MNTEIFTIRKSGFIINRERFAMAKFFGYSNLNQLVFDPLNPTKIKKYEV